MQTARFEGAGGRHGAGDSSNHDGTDGRSMLDSKIEIREKSASIVEQSRLEIMDIKRQYDENDTLPSNITATRKNDSSSGKFGDLHSFEENTAQKQQQQALLKLALETSDSIRGGW